MRPNETSSDSGIRSSLWNRRSKASGCGGSLDARLESTSWWFFALGDGAGDFIFSRSRLHFASILSLLHLGWLWTSRFLPRDDTCHISIDDVWSLAEVVIAWTYSVISLPGESDKIWLLFDELSFHIFLVPENGLMTRNRWWINDFWAASRPWLVLHIQPKRCARFLVNNLLDILGGLIVGTWSGKHRPISELTVIESIFRRDKIARFFDNFYTELFNSLLSQMLSLIHFFVNVCKSLLIYLVLARTWSHLVLWFDHLDLESPVLFDGLVIIGKVRSGCRMRLNAEMTRAWSQRHRLVHASQILIALDVSTVAIHHSLKRLLHRYGFQLILFS